MEMKLPFKLHCNTFYKLGRNYLLKILEITKNELVDSFEIEEVFIISTQLNLNETNAHFEEPLYCASMELFPKQFAE